MNPVAPIILAITYVLISARRLGRLALDRPAAALLGAVACVAARTITPAEAVAAVDGGTILLLLGVMGMGAFLLLDGFFAELERALVSFARTPARLIGMLVWGTGLLGALITNDAVCVLGAPLVVRIVRRQSLPPLPYLLALATAANTGSVATLVGNPQNMLCASLGDLSYLEHLALAGPLAIAGLAVNHALLLFLFRGRLGDGLHRAALPGARGRGRIGLTLGVILATAIAYSAGADLPWTAAAGFTALLVIHGRDAREVWARIDWSLLLFFASLFVVVRAFSLSGYPAKFFASYPLGQLGPGWIGRIELSLLFLIGSNLVSNVPFILVIGDQLTGLPDPRHAWELLAIVSTFAGNLTLLGSAANIIVAEAAREVGGIGFREHIRVGLPLTVLTTAIAVAWLTLAAR